MTPQASTHGTEMTQRLYFATIVTKTSTQLTIKAPKDATILLQGYIMIFLVNDKTLLSLNGFVSVIRRFV
jgi:hypothetical protein